MMIAPIAWGVSMNGKVKGRAYLCLAFTDLTVGGKTYKIAASRVSVLAPATHGRDAKVVGGAAAGGAVVGAIADGKKGAALGGLPRGRRGHRCRPGHAGQGGHPAGRLALAGPSRQAAVLD
jgi:hypothetical protein